MVRETPPGYGNPIDDSRESSLPMGVTSPSGELVGATLEPCATVKRPDDAMTHVSHGSSAYKTSSNPGFVDTTLGSPDTTCCGLLSPLTR